MRSQFLFFLASALAATLCACGSSVETANTGSPTNSHPSVTAVNSSSPTTNANVLPGGPATAENPTLQSPEAPPAANVEDPRIRRLEMLKQGANATASGPRPKPSQQPAPDNSTYTVELAEAAVETRVFKSHPQLVKVEKRTDANGSSIRVTLKGGKVVSLPGDRIQALATVPASVIMDALGLAPTGAAPAGKNGPK